MSNDKKRPANHPFRRQIIAGKILKKKLKDDPDWDENITEGRFSGHAKKKER
jgi:hypothetical protein